MPAEHILCGQLVVDEQETVRFSGLDPDRFTPRTQTRASCTPFLLPSAYTVPQIDPCGATRSPKQTRRTSTHDRETAPAGPASGLRRLYPTSGTAETARPGDRA